MSTACAAFDPIGPFVTGLTSYVDCRVSALGEDGYLGMGSAFGGVLTGLLTIYVALIGYRLVVGEVPSLREGLVAAIKIGFVVALATQWPTYQALVYRVVIAGPEEMVATLLGGDVGQRLALAARVQSAYGQLETARERASANVDAPLVSGPEGPVIPDAVSAAGPPVTFEAIALRSSTLVLLMASVAGLVSVRLVAGLFLALGPLFVIALLFDATRGLFEGWVRGLAGAALGAVGVAVVLVLELAILEPQSVALTRANATGLTSPQLQGEILATTMLFGLVLLATILACGRLAAGFRLPDVVRERMAGIAALLPSTGIVPASAAPSAPPAERHDRALAIADAMGAAQRRELLASAAAPADGPRRMAVPVAALAAGMIGTALPLGQRGRGTQSQRRSATAARRDARR
jgi:type IV secretion system protein VirB6